MINSVSLNPFAISGLLIGLTSTALTIIIVLYGSTKLHRIYGIHTLFVAIWGFSSFLIGITTNSAISSILWKVAYSAVIFIPVLFLHVVLILCNKARKFLLFFAYLGGVFFVSLNILNRLFSDVKFMFNSFYYVQGGWVYFVSFLFWSSLAIYEHYELLKFYIETKKENSKQNFYFFVSALVGFVGGVTNFLPGFNINIYPYGNFAIPFYVLIIAYGIFKYQILNIKIVIQKGFVYSLLIALITATYFIFVFLAEHFFKGIIGYKSLIISVSYAFFIALFFNPIKNKIQRFADKIFLGKDPIQIAQENELLRYELMRSEKLKTIATFASGMAHEIKNPLTAIKTFTEYLPEKTEDKEFLGKFSKIVGSEVEKIDNLVHQLLDFSKPAPLQLKETDIHKLIDDTLELLSSQFIKYNIKVIKEYNTNLHKSNTNEHELIRENSCVISANSCLIKVDPNQMKQVFLNLFLNAIEAMPKGGTLTVSTNLCSVANYESLPAGQAGVLICVQDTGCGISEKDLPHIFEPFYTTKEKGSGLGLSIVYNIIKEHKGSISVESTINQGSRFVVRLSIN